MTAEIYIISGFLGAGKTTLIQKLLKESFQYKRVVLIENDFGEISVDAALLKAGGVEVKEINSGCICCSLSGNFMKALKELLAQYQPEVILIEPSGVGRLSDIMKACSDADIQQLAKVAAKITVADVKRCKMYSDNFGEFFEDQIKNADVILLSRTDKFPEKIETAEKLVKGLNTHAHVLSAPWDTIAADNILSVNQNVDTSNAQSGQYSHKCSCGHDYESNHNHDAEDIFDTVTIKTNRKFCIESIKARFSEIEHGRYGTIIRAKGIVRGSDGYINLQYVPGDFQITRCDSEGGTVCLIGRSLNRNELFRLFDKE